jgi:hypothetical protein
MDARPVREPCPERLTSSHGYRGAMANEQGPLAPRARLHAGTAFKAGFFGAFGVFVFSLALTLVVGVIALVLAALDVLPGVARAFRDVTGP